MSGKRRSLSVKSMNSSSIFTSSGIKASLLTPAEGLDTGAFDYELIYGVGPGMDKRTRLHMGESLMTHAMVFTGYDRRPVRGQTDAAR